MQDLQVIIKEHGLEPSKAKTLLEKFQDVFTLASEWEQKAKTLTVSASSQVAEMKMAREGRLFLRSKRIEIENTRKALKEEYLRGGKAVDGIANVLKAIIEPIEEYLEQQETFAEHEKEAQILALCDDRKRKLAIYTDQYAFQDSMLKMLTEEAFTNLLNGEKQAFDKREQEKAEAEAVRIAAENARIAEEKRIREENERLKAEAAKKAAELKAAQEEATKREAAEREKTRLAEEAATKARQALAEKEKEEQKAKAEVAKKAKSAALAPDKEKLEALAVQVESLVLPSLNNAESAAILEGVKQCLNKTAIYIREKANQL